jgi:hypothetical protein
MTKWILVKHEGTIEAERWELPGRLDETQVVEIVRRLVCRSLSEDDIINSSLPEDDIKRYILLDRNDDPAVIHMGENPYYVATFEA